MGGAGQDLQHALADLLDIGLARAQVSVFDFIELRGQLVDLGQQRPFGVVVTAADDLERRFRQHRVGQDQRMDIDESAQLGRRIRRQLGPQRLQFLVDAGDRILQPLDLSLHFFLWNQVVLDIQRRRRDQMGAADGDAA